MGFSGRYGERMGCDVLYYVVGGGLVGCLVGGKARGWEVMSLFYVVGGGVLGGV